MNLTRTIKSIQDIMRKDVGVDGDAQRLGQLTWMLFLKVFDQKYQSPLPERLRWRNWAAYVPGKDGKKTPQTPAGEIIGFVNDELFPYLKKLDAKKSPRHKVIREVFEDANNFMKSGPLLLAVIEKLEEAIDLHEFKTRANLGDVYEQLLNDLRSAGNAGEFYTPRAITQFMVDRLSPSLEKQEKVLDPACGTGGFLTAVIDHLRSQRTTQSGTKEARAIEEAIRGIEKKQLPHLLCTTNMLLHGVDVPSQIDHRNTLAAEWDEWSDEDEDKFDCVITNPPFGGYEEDGVDGTYPPEVRTRETADMFMALIVVKLLKKNGRAAVVLPDGFLFGEGIKATLKRMLLRDCNLHTIVRLPRGVFAPYTTIKTNLLFFTKGAAVNDGREHFHTDTIWYYEHPYPTGYKSYSKTKPIRIEEFDPERAWWGKEEDGFAGRVENEYAWKVDFKSKREEAERLAEPHRQRAKQLNNDAVAVESRMRELRDSIKGAQDEKKRNAVEEQIETLRAQAAGLRLQARNEQATADRLYWPIYNLDLGNPNAPEEENHDPDTLLEKYRGLLGRIEETENRFKSELAAALGRHLRDENT